jgi:hypothetical protein
MTLVLKNNASSTLAGSITNVATAISIASGDSSKFPVIAAGQWHPITVADGLGNMEIMRVTARSGAVLTVVRAQEGTSAFAFSAGASVQLRPTAGSLLEALGAKADAVSPTIDDDLHILGNIPTLWFEEEDNAGVGRSWFLRLNGDVLTMKRDLNADDDTSDAGETTPVFAIDGADESFTINFGLIAETLRWNNSVDKSGTNLNALITSGFYIGNNLTNAPGGSSSRFWIMVQHGANDDNVSQTAWSHSPAMNIYQRFKASGTWGPWKAVSNPALQELGEGTTAPSGKKRIPAFDSTGTLAANGATLDLATGADLLNSGTPLAARNAMEIGLGTPVGFNRIHAGSDLTNYSFGTDTTECSIVSQALIKSSRNSGVAMQLQRVGSNGDIFQVFKGTSQVGGISVTATATSFNTSSDYRRKFDVVSLVNFSLSLDDWEFFSASRNLLEMLSLRPVAHRWKGVDAPDSPYTFGYLAHELQLVLPLAVTGEKDAEIEVGTATVAERTEILSPAVSGEDGEVEVPAVTRTYPAEVFENISEADAASLGASWQKTGTVPSYQTIDPSKIIPKLNASIQELSLLVLEQSRALKALSDRVAQLEA